MLRKFNLSFASTKFVLYQRTNYIKQQKKLFIKLISKTFSFLNFNRYNVSIILEALLNRSFIARLYYKDIEKELIEMRPFLPDQINALLDIGCGIGGIDALIYQFYFPNKIDLYLADKTKKEKNIWYLFNEKGAFYNSLDQTRRFLMQNNVESENIHIIEVAAEKKCFNLNKKFDLVVSFISWGFHYPVATYLEEVNGLLTPNGSIIIDIRKETDGLEIVRKYLPNITLISEDSKKIRIKASRLSVAQVSKP